jgi:hypothetical protein
MSGFVLEQPKVTRCVAVAEPNGSIGGSRAGSDPSKTLGFVDPDTGKVEAKS